MLTFGTVVLLVAGCGGTSGSSATAGPSAGHGSGTNTTVAKAQAVAYAHEVNLTATDVPGAVVRSAERESATPSKADVEFARCTGGVNPNRRIADIKSASLRIGSGSTATQVKSSVEMMPNAALAARNYAAVLSARGHRCLARLLPQDLHGAATGTARVGPVTSASLPSLLSTGQQSFGIRVSTSITTGVGGKQVSRPLYVDVFSLLAGPAEVELGVTALSHPASTATEHRLLSLLYSRAQAHKL